MLRYIFCIIIFSNALLEATKEGCLLPPPALFISKEATHFAPYLPKVNVITGEYCEEEVDIVVRGVEPISFRRFYNHQGHKDQAFGHWRINPECLMLFNFDLTKIGCRAFKKLASIGEADGSFFLYDNNIGNHYFFNPDSMKAFTSPGFVGLTHPLNTHFSFQQWGKGKDTDRFSYRGSVIDGSGRVRTFMSVERSWPRDSRVESDVETSPPYQAMVTESKLPNGNLILYEYINYNAPLLHDRYDPGYYILKSIKAYNAKRSILLGSLDIDYERGPSKRNYHMLAIHVTGSDGRKADLYQSIREVKPRDRRNGSLPIYDVVLDHVEAPEKPPLSYNYCWKRAKNYFDTPFLYHVEAPEGRLLETDYDFGTKKVLFQKAPVGAGGELVPIARYDYREDHTIVYDGENNKTIYRINCDKRINGIEKYQGNTLYSIEIQSWDPLTGNLTKKTLKDASGKIVKRMEYGYDKNQNLTRESIGDGREKDTIYRTYSTDGFNLKLSESDRPEKVVRYSYIPQTNLLKSEIVYENEKIAKRAFHFYEDENFNSVRTKTIIDDGKSLDPKDLKDVTYRKITLFTPKYSSPCIGLPEKIREKTIDSSGKEVLLKKIRFSYHPSGKILREDHYDANGLFKYSQSYEYDGMGRLKMKKDALGNQVEFQYDANFNLIAEIGPRSDMRKEWDYDLANRPIEERIWQSDGTILTNEKKYDKASRLTSTIDASGFETLYAYDALGRVTAITYPDDAITKKEYDILGNVIKEVDPNGYETSREYNFRGAPLAVYYPDGSFEKFAYNENGGTLASYIDRNGAKTLYTYDIFDHLIKTELFSSSGKLLKTKSSTYSPFCKLSDTDPAGITTTYTYDFAGRKIGEEKNGHKISYFYDSLGRHFKTLSGETSTIDEYNLLNQVIEKRREDIHGKILFLEKYFYDAAGNLTHTANSKGVFKTRYNTLGLPTRKIDSLGFETHFSYIYQGGLVKIETTSDGVQRTDMHDARGNCIKSFKKNAEGKTIWKIQRYFDPAKNLVEESHHLFANTKPLKIITHSWVYGPCGRIEQLLEAGKKKTQYFYDFNGRVKTKGKPDGKELHFEYDEEGSLTRHFSEDFDDHYTYDANGRLISAGSTTRSYDERGLIQERLGNGLEISNTYDNRGRRIALHLQDTSSICYTYRGDLLYQVSRNQFDYTYLQRDLQGNVTKILLPEKLGEVEIEHDAFSRLRHFSSAYYSAIFKKSAYDSMGNLCHYIYKDALGTAHCTFGYDPLHQLISENDHSYLFDSLGNCLKKDDIEYEVDDLCLITSDGNTKYEYDANGNLIFDGKTHYTYDSRDRLTLLERGDLRVAYTYDSFHRRLSKKFFEKEKEVEQQLYLWDGLEEIGSVDAKGKIQELRILGEGKMGRAILFELQGTSYLPFHDTCGSLVTLVNLATKKPDGTYRYTAFGEKLTQGLLAPWRFGGHRIDPETGLIFTEGRYYSPSLGRFITSNPHGHLR